MVMVLLSMTLKMVKMVKDVKFYPATCVLPPEGQNSVDWIKGGNERRKSANLMNLSPAGF